MFKDEKGDIIIVNRYRNSSILNIPGYQNKVPPAYLIICRLPACIDGKRARKIIWEVIKKR